jgi:hypothetical protein
MANHPDAFGVTPPKPRRGLFLRAGPDSPAGSGGVPVGQGGHTCYTNDTTTVFSDIRSLVAKLPGHGQWGVQGRFVRFSGSLLQRPSANPCEANSEIRRRR